MQFINSQDREALLGHERHLLDAIKSKFNNIKEIKIHSKAISTLGIMAFSIDNCHSMDIASLLDEQNIAIRSGQLCAMPLVRKLDNNGILRVSFSIYNSVDEVTRFVDALKQAISLLRD